MLNEDRIMKTFEAKNRDGFRLYTLGCKDINFHTLHN